jgi:hypothetical protein
MTYRNKIERTDCICRSFPSVNDHETTTRSPGELAADAAPWVTVGLPSLVSCLILLSGRNAVIRTLDAWHPLQDNADRLHAGTNTNTHPKPNCHTRSRRAAPQSFLAYRADQPLKKMIIPDVDDPSRYGPGYTTTPTAQVASSTPPPRNPPNSGLAIRAW